MLACIHGDGGGGGGGGTNKIHVRNGPWHNMLA